MEHEIGNASSQSDGAANVSLFALALMLYIFSLAVMSKGSRTAALCIIVGSISLIALLVYRLFRRR